MEEDKTKQNAHTVEEIVEVDGKKMKKIKYYEQKLVREFIPKGRIARESLQPFGIEKIGEPPHLDKNPVFFEVHGRGKQIKVKVDTLPKIKAELRDIDKAIEGEQIRMKELDEDTGYDFSRRNFGDRQVNEDAVVRVSNIPDEMRNYDIREQFKLFGSITMITMPRPIPVTEEQKRNMRRMEKRKKKQAKRESRKFAGPKKDIKKEEGNEDKEENKAGAKEAEPEKTHRGYAYIYYENIQSAERAIKELHDKSFFGQVISVQKARARRPQQSY